MYQRIFFDFDGTILDTQPGVLQTLRFALEKNGVAYAQEQLSTFIGPPMYAHLRKVFGMDDALAAAVTADYRARYRESGLYANRRYRGVEGMLRRLRLQGRQLWVVTNKPDAFVRPMLAREGLDGYFDGIVGAQMADREDRKAQRLSWALAQGEGSAVMVGDRENDVFAAQAAGIDSIYVGYGFGSRQEAEACAPTYYVPDVESLAALLGVGLFLTFEGGDGAGKSTQIALLADFLREQGCPVLVTREPGGTPLAEEIRAMLLDVRHREMTPQTEALLYAAARAQHVSEVIRPALQAGKAVLCDRYYDSSVAYQAFGRQLGTDWVAALNAPALSGPMPVRTYYLCADARTARERMAREKDRMELSGEAFDARVRQGFEFVRKENPNRVFFIDAACTIEEISDIIKRDVSALIC